jgi:hypothetical protein
LPPPPEFIVASALAFTQTPFWQTASATGCGDAHGVFVAGAPPAVGAGA